MGNPPIPPCIDGPSSLFATGHTSRGTGILNNELYNGQLVWNRQRWLKNPDNKGKRVPRLNPRSEWITHDVPDLRIVDATLWGAAKARQSSIRPAMKTGIVRARRPKYLFSGLTECDTCGGGFILSSHDRLVCFNARSRGTCNNRRSITRHDVEARVLHAMRERFFDPGAFAAFYEGFHAELEVQRREHLAVQAAARGHLAAAERRQKEIMESLIAGYRCEAWKAELLTLEARQAELKAALAAKPLPALHPKMADIFREKATTLAAGLQKDDQRDAARLALRGFLDKIIIPPGDELLQVIGNAGAMLAAAAGRAVNSVGIVGCGGPQPAEFGILLDCCVAVLCFEQSPALKGSHTQQSRKHVRTIALCCAPPLVFAVHVRCHSADVKQETPNLRRGDSTILAMTSLAPRGLELVHGARRAGSTSHARSAADP